MQTLLKQFCRSLHLDHVGIAPAGRYTDLEQRLRSRFDNGYAIEFDNPDLEKRICPAQTMPDVRSIVVCLFPYYTGIFPNANLSKYTYAPDYHTIIKSTLTQIGLFMQQHIPGFEYQAFADNGPLVDRYLAYLAGLGFYGINSHLITPKYGSYVFIGYMLTNYPFEPGQPLPYTCMQCGRCIQACPGQSIRGDFSIDPRRCKSYLTQKKGELTAAEVQILTKNTLVFGCDVCQDICPHNQQVSRTPIAAFTENLLTTITAEKLAGLSNKQFTVLYHNRAFSWRGKKILARNLNLISPDGKTMSE